MNVPIAALAFVMGLRLLSSSAGRADAGKLDLRGFLLLSPGLAGLVFGLSETETHGGFGDPLALVPILAGLALVAAFVAHSLRAPRPLIDIRLFKSRGFGGAAGTTFLLGGALFGAMIILPLYYQLARGQSALTAGLLMAPQGVGAAIAMPLAGRLTDTRIGNRVPLAGVLALTLSTVPFAFLSADTPFGLLGGILVVRGLGLGFAMMPAMAAAYDAAAEAPASPQVAPPELDHAVAQRP